MRNIQVIGHRGACAYAPENTIASFQKAIEMEADSIETDIRRTSDGILVLIHDPSMDRTSNGSGPVEEHTYGQLKKLDMGSWFSPEFLDERIVTFYDFLETFGKRIHLTLELKSEEIEEDVIRTINCHNLNPKEFTITSFNFDMLLNVKSIFTSVRMGFLTKEFNDRLIENCVKHDIGQICPNANVLDVNTVSQANANNLSVRAWGVKDISLMEHAVACGVNGMTIDYPDKLISYINNQE